MTTSITPPVVLPQGTYWVSAVADLNRAMSEPNEINNGLTSFTATKVQRPLSKLNRAAISLTPNGCGDVSGQAINLGGTFVLTTIGTSTANGTFDLTGNFNGDPSRASRFKGTFTAAFNGANDDLSLTMVFTTITGFFTGIGSGSAAGTYDGRVFEAESPDDGVTPALTGSLTRTTTAAHVHLRRIAHGDRRPGVQPHVQRVGHRRGLRRRSDGDAGRHAHPDRRVRAAVRGGVGRKLPDRRQL